MEKKAASLKTKNIQESLNLTAYTIKPKAIKCKKEAARLKKKKTFKA